MSIWCAPIALGLLAALVSDGIGDVWSWIALASPLAVAAWCLRRRPHSNNEDPS